MPPRMQPCDFVQAALDHPTCIHEQHDLPWWMCAHAGPNHLANHMHVHVRVHRVCSLTLSLGARCLPSRRSCSIGGPQPSTTASPNGEPTPSAAGLKTQGYRDALGYPGYIMGRQQQRVTGWSRPAHVRCDRPESRLCNAASRSMPPSLMPKMRW
jgi:hypothetical protein